MLYRVFWNLNAGPDNQWCIDTGPGTERVWAKTVTFACLSFTSLAHNNEQHPKGWISARGKLRIDDKGNASISGM
jgi:hypothetical protein